LNIDCQDVVRVSGLMIGGTQTSTRKYAEFGKDIIYAYHLVWSGCTK